jgi:hypothetical protein
MCLIDYRGFRVVAMSLLPVNKETIIYGMYIWYLLTLFSRRALGGVVSVSRSNPLGSCDAGASVFHSDLYFNELMELAAKRLNLAPHYVGKPDNLVRMCAPIDIEGRTHG